MKKNLLLAIFVLSCGNIYSQWAPAGAKWTYTLHYNMSSVIDTFVIRSIGDTNILGQQCKILEKSNTVCDVRPKREFMYSDNGKVYFYDDYRNSFQLLYDFNAQVGDTIVLFPSTLPNYDYDSIINVVDSIQTVTINSFVLKKIFSHSLFPSTSWWQGGGGEIIENIGNINYMFPWLFGACDIAWAGPLRCYEDPIIGFYDFNTGYSCDYTTINIKENNNGCSFSVFPNPASNQINIENNYGENIIFYIINIFGDIVKSGFVNQRYSKILVSDLSTGIYIIVVADTDKTLSNRKFVIHR